MAPRFKVFNENSDIPVKFLHILLWIYIPCCYNKFTYYLCIEEGEDEGEEIGEKEGQYFVDQATGQYYFQTSDGETMTVVSAPGVEEPGMLL